MKLSQPDKVALMAYLSKDMHTEETFKTDEFGRIKLTKEMREAVVKAERDFEDGKCLTEADLVLCSLRIWRQFLSFLMSVMVVITSVKSY